MTPPKTLLFIVGPQAVGKMTVGQELSRVTGLKFMHNHQTIDLLAPIFGFASPSFERLSFEIRLGVMNEVAAGELPGLIFSCIIDFDDATDMARAESYASAFIDRGGRVLFVELAASLETRLRRNRTENRKLHKALKRDVEFSGRLVHEGEARRCNSDGDFPFAYPHMKIVNDGLSVEVVVGMIREGFGV